MGDMPYQRFDEFRDELPIRCQCGGIFVNMDKLNFANYKVSYPFGIKIINKSYQPKLLYICSACRHAIWIGDYEGGGSTHLGEKVV